MPHHDLSTAATLQKHTEQKFPKDSSPQKPPVGNETENNLREGYLLSLEVRRLYQALGTVKSQIISIAEQANPYRRKTVKLNAGKYCAVILFKEDKTYSPVAIPAIRDLLGEAKFSKLFREKTEYKGNHQSLKSFLSSVTNDPNEIKAKELIQRAEVCIISQPYIKFTLDDLDITQDKERTWGNE